MEILNELIKQQQQIQKELEELNKNLIQENKKAQVINVNSQMIAEEIKRTIPKPSDFDNVSGKIGRLVNEIPRQVKVNIPNEVWGFTGFKSLLAHYGITILIVFTSIGIYHYLKTEEIEKYKKFVVEYRDTRIWLEERYPKVHEKWKKDFFK
jgi:hypothetical protein